MWPRNSDFDEEDDEILDDDYVDDDADEEEDEEDLLERVESAFRTDRARIRQSDSIYELRLLKVEYQDLESNGRLSQAGRIRARDLMELVDQRITDLRAASGSR